MCAMWIQVLKEARKGIRSPGTGVAGVFWAPRCGCWELSLRPLKEQQTLLTTEPSLLPSLLKTLEFYYYQWACACVRVCVSAGGHTPHCHACGSQETPRTLLSLCWRHDLVAGCLSMVCGAPQSPLPQKPPPPPIPSLLQLRHHLDLKAVPMRVYYIIHTSHFRIMKEYKNIYYGINPWW